MAVEHDPRVSDVAEQRDTGRELVDEVYVILWRAWGEQMGDEMKLACVGKEDMEFALDMSREGRWRGVDAERS
jgi:hypothetical protein